MLLCEIHNRDRVERVCKKCNHKKMMDANTHICKKCKQRAKEKNRLDNLAKPAPVSVVSGGLPSLGKR